jgi:hypothetical protein
VLRITKEEHWLRISTLWIGLMVENLKRAVKIMRELKAITDSVETLHIHLTKTAGTF